MNLNRTINLNKKFILILVLINVIAISLYYSYALFQVNIIKNNVVVIQSASNLNITTTIAGTNSNVVTLSAGQTKTISVNLTSSATGSNMAYKLYYEIPSGTGTFQVTSTDSYENDIVAGIMKGNKTISLTITNTGTSSLTLTLGALGGFDGVGVSLSQGHNVVLNKTLGTIESGIKSSLENKTCKTYIEEDNITYLSGTNDCIDFNYVWYSGKMWRITAIYSDGSMKLITDKPITNISYNTSGNVNFYTNSTTSSYVYQWLNEDFYDTLYNASNFIDTTKQWNQTMSSDENISTKLAETNLVSSNVGLLNSYEVYMSYKNVNSESYTNTAFLYKNYDWWLLNPYYNTSSPTYTWIVRSVTIDGRNPNMGKGIRPALYIKANLKFTGEGTLTNPYRLDGDKATGAQNEKVYNRLSGEYVKLKNGNNEQVFRIVGVENNKTKIVAIDYADGGATKPFATDATGLLYGSGTTTGSGTWYTYLTSTYYPNLVDTYGNLFASATYYMGQSGDNYKLSICANTTSGSTNVCTKTSNSGTFNIGLLRYGEMFASHPNLNSRKYIWLINPKNTSTVFHIQTGGHVGNLDPTNSYSAYPTVHLNQNVKILSGTGLPNDPYVVGL